MKRFIKEELRYRALFFQHKNLVNAILPRARRTALDANKFVKELEQKAEKLKRDMKAIKLFPCLPCAGLGFRTIKNRRTRCEECNGSGDRIRR